MTLSQYEQEAVLEILDVLYNGALRGQGKPTEETIELLEKILTDIKDCDSKVTAVFASVPCASMRTREWLRRCLKIISKVMRSHKAVFIGCHQTVLWVNKSKLALTLQY